MKICIKVDVEEVRRMRNNLMGKRMHGDMTVDTTIALLSDVVQATRKVEEAHRLLLPDNLEEENMPDDMLGISGMPYQ